MKTVKTASKRTLSLLLALMVLFSGAVLAAEPTYTTVSGTYGQTEARTMLQMVNDYRASPTDAWYFDKDNTTKIYCKNLKPLTYDYELEKVAMQRAAELVVSYGHVRPNGESCSTAYPSGVYQAKGENIAKGSIYETARNIMGLDPVFSYSLPNNEDYGWMETNEGYWNQGHRRTILSDSFTAMGAAHFVVGSTHYWVQEFGRPASGAATSGAAATPANDSAADVQVPTNGSESGGENPTNPEDPSLPTLFIADVFFTRSAKKQVKQVLYPSSYSLSFQSSGNSKKISISPQGKITIAANYVGVVTVTATGKMNGVACKPATFKVTVRPPSPPLPYVKADKKRKVTAKWGRDKKVDGYQVQFSKDWDFKTIADSKKLKGNKKLTYTSKALKKGNHYVRVRSYKNSGGVKVWSNWRIRTVKVK